MKIRYTDVTTQPDGGQLKGLAASYEATDSDGLGNTGLDSGAISPSEGYEPSYSSIAQVEALSQTQIYNDFYPVETIQVVVGYELDLELTSDGSMDSAGDIDHESEVNPIYETQSVGEEWLISLQESLDLQIEIGKESRNPTIEIADEITDQTPIEINVIGGGGSGPGATPPSYYDPDVRTNMQQYVGDSWDGSTAGVTLITSWETLDGTSPPPGSPASWDGDIGPGGGHPARGSTWKYLEV